LTLAGIGQSTCIGIGGDQIIGTNFVDCLDAFNKDSATKAIVMIGEIGGSDEEEAAVFIKKHVKKPVIGFIAGRTAPADKRMGHAGAIISGSSGTAADKIAALEKSGVPVASSPTEIPKFVKQMLKTGKVVRPAPVKAAKKTESKKPKPKISSNRPSFTIRKAAKGPSR
jgi:succinyl-CoA synthetase alpha subunit